jgi:hypothetical protein
MLFGFIASVLTEERVTEKAAVDDRPSHGILLWRELDYCPACGTQYEATSSDIQAVSKL